MVPLLAAVLVFCGVLLITPPGFNSLPGVLLNTARAQNAEAAAYALGAAASLALGTLIALSGACFVIGLLRRRA